MKISAILFLAIAFIECKSPYSNSPQKIFERILQDTTNNSRAKLDLQQLEHYNNICKAIGINKLYDGADSLEVRVWHQFSFFGMATDEEIYSLKLVDSSISLTFYRIFCTNYDYDNETHRDWDAFVNPKIDSFLAFSKTFPRKILDSINLNEIWGIETQSALNIPDSIGYLDGSTTSIEIASNSKYKLIRHHVAHLYLEKIGKPEIWDYLKMYNKLVSIFYSNKVYDSNYLPYNMPSPKNK